MSCAVTIPHGTALYALPIDFALEHGGVLHGAQIAYEVLGPASGPMVVVQGGISAGRHVARTDSDPTPGWWEAQVGPGLAIDPRRFRVLATDYLGGAGASSGPDNSAQAPFPAVTSSDQARAILHLLASLGERDPVTYVGASYGGMVGLALAALASLQLRHLVVISAADRSHPLATAWRSLQRRIVELGLARGATREALELARGLAMTSYRAPAEFAARFDVPPRVNGPRASFAVEDYLRARGRAFAACFDAHSFLSLSQAIDLHRVDPAAVAVATTLVAVDSDQLVPRAQMRELARRLGGSVRLVEIDSRYGHDAFLKEVDALAPVLRGALPHGEVTR